jgi:hypothetical protein
MSEQKELFLTCYRKVYPDAKEYVHPPFKQVKLCGRKCVYSFISYPEAKVVVHDCIQHVFDLYLQRQEQTYPFCIDVEMNKEGVMSCRECEE